MPRRVKRPTSMLDESTLEDGPRSEESQADHSPRVGVTAKRVRWDNPSEDLQDERDSSNLDSFVPAKVV